MDIFKLTKELFNSFDFVETQLSHCSAHNAIIAGFLLSKLPNSKETVVKDINEFHEICLKWNLQLNERIVYFSGILQRYFSAKELSCSNIIQNTVQDLTPSQAVNQDKWRNEIRTVNQKYISNKINSCDKFETLNSVAFKLSDGKNSNISIGLIDVDKVNNHSCDKESGYIFPKSQLIQNNSSKKIGMIEDVSTKRKFENNKNEEFENCMHILTADSCINVNNYEENEINESQNNDQRMHKRLRSKVNLCDKEKYMQTQLEQSITCVICSKMITGPYFATNRCGHSFHHNCIKAYLTNKLKLGRISYKCPANKCTICMEFK